MATKSSAKRKAAQPKKRAVAKTKKRSLRVVSKTQSKKKPIKKKKTSAKKKPKKLSAAANEARIESLILDHRENGRKLARSILRRWRVRMPSDEIDSVVDLALCEAARRFSEEHGASFMTFYFYHLRGHLVRTVARAAQSNNIFMAFAKTIGIDPGDWQHVNNEVIWTYAPDNMIFGQRDVDTPEHNILRKEKIDQCSEAVTKLDPLEQEIIYRSYQGEQPLVNIARSLGYSRCHISRVKKAALGRLKAILEENGESVRPYDNGQLRELATGKNIGSGRIRTKRRARRRSLETRSQSFADKTSKSRAA